MSDRTPRRPLPARHPRHRSSGLTLAELLIVLALSGLMLALIINLTGTQRGGSESWGRVADDYVRQLESGCNSVRLSSGRGPMQARRLADAPAGNHRYQYIYSVSADADPEGYQGPGYTAKCATHPESPETYLCNNDIRGIALYLGMGGDNGRLVEDGLNSHIAYPNGILVYLLPTMTPDPGNEIPNAGADSSPANFDYDDIMNVDGQVRALDGKPIFADDRQWLLLDMNGTTAPNSIGPNGDRVLLYVDDDTCKVLTARQMCKLNERTANNGNCNDVPGNTTYPQSFYDVYKGYCASFTTSSTCDPLSF